MGSPCGDEQARVADGCDTNVSANPSEPGVTTLPSDTSDGGDATTGAETGTSSGGSGSGGTAG